MNNRQKEIREQLFRLTCKIKGVSPDYAKWLEELHGELLTMIDERDKRIEEPKTIDELRVSVMIAEIKRLHVFEGYKLVEAFGGDYESPDDFVSASELNVLLEKYDG